MDKKNTSHRNYNHFFCICCSKPIRKLYKESSYLKVSIESDAYNDGMVDSISGGYGSNHDTDVFFVAICNDCTNKAIKDGRLVYKYNYMFSNINKEEIDEEYLKGYDRRTRGLNIDDLLDDDLLDDDSLDDSLDDDSLDDD